MSSPTTIVSEHDLIAEVIQRYIEGAKSGKGDDMRPAFHKDATVFGYVGADLFAGPIQQLFAWNDENGSALVDPFGKSTKAARRHDRRYRLGSLSDLGHDVSRTVQIQFGVNLGDSGRSVPQHHTRRFDAELLA